MSRRPSRVPGTYPRHLRRALRGMDGGPQLCAALDEVRASAPDFRLVVVDNGSRGPNIMDTRGLPPGSWVIDRVLPSGVVGAVCDLDDPTPETLIENGIDVVVHLGSRGAMTDAPVLLTVYWRPGLAADLGCEPPDPFWIRWSAGPGGFVRLDDDNRNDADDASARSTP